MATIVEGNPKAPFSIATTPRCKGGRYSFLELLYFTLDPYLIMLSVKQGGIKYHFLSLWYDSTWDWTQVSRAIGEPRVIRGFKKVNAPGENSNTSNFKEIKMILLMFTSSQDLYLGVYTNLIIGKCEKCWNTYFKC